MKFFYYFYLVLFVKTNGQQECELFPYKEEFKQIHKQICSNNTKINSNQNCNLPTSEHIQKALEKYDYVFSVAYFLDLPEVQEKFSKIPLRKYSLTSFNETKGQTNCILKTKTLPHETGVCPYHYVVQYRPDKIPNFRKQAICNCQHECHAVVIKVVNDNLHKCSQIIKIAPFLELGKCVKSGNQMEYELKLAFEEVSVACECMQQPDLQRHR
jgi:hypothetical protein